MSPTEKKIRHLLYRVSWGHRPRLETLRALGLPEDINPLHPLVLKRKKRGIN